MNRMLRTGLALLSVIALSAVAASAAQANWQLTAGAHPAILTGEQVKQEVHTSQLNITSGSAPVKCNEGHYLGTVETAVFEEATIHPTYANCSGAGVNVDVRTKGCDYTLTAATDSEKHQPADIVCNEGKKIEVELTVGATCIATIAAQATTTGGIVYTNHAGSPDDVTGTATVKNIKYTRDGTGTLCKLAIPKAEGEDADFETEITLRAYEDKGCEGSLTEETYKCTEGNQVSLTAAEH